MICSSTFPKVFICLDLTLNKCIVLSKEYVSFDNNHYTPLSHNDTWILDRRLGSFRSPKALFDSCLNEGTDYFRLQTSWLLLRNWYLGWEIKDFETILCFLINVKTSIKIMFKYFQMTFLLNYSNCKNGRIGIRKQTHAL